jgi:hypothetical protein
MKKLSYILIPFLMLSIFLAPVAPSLKGEAGNLAVVLKTNMVMAGTAQTNNDFLGSVSCVPFSSNFSVVGCVAILAYYGLYTVSALVAHGAEIFLDTFFYLSISDIPYRSDFVSAGWGIVRDICNMFFIIGLLYIAIRTILGLGHDNKKMIAGVVVMALLINFSMFFTNVIIDSSNVLAHVFYNKTNVTINGQVQTGPGGQKSIADAIITQVNPQQLINPDIVAHLGDQDTHNWWDSVGGYLAAGGVGGVAAAVIGGVALWPVAVGIGVGVIIHNVFAAGDQQLAAYILLLSLLGALVNIMIIYVYLSIGLLFLARIVSLLFALILSPLAFVSYFFPGMKSLSYIGWDKWSKQVVELAFLAPIIAFFLYVITKMGEIAKLGATVAGQDKSTGFTKVFLIIIPIAFIIALLLTAKKVATKLAGQMGEIVNKIGALATGLEIGAVAAVGRRTLGRVGSAAANSGLVKRWEAAGYGGGAARRLFESMGKGSMDIRGIKVAGKSLGETGFVTGTVTGVGGFEKARSDKVKARQERAKSLAVGEDEELKQNLNRTEDELQALLLTNSHELEELDKRIKTARERASDASRRSRTNGPLNVNPATSLTYGAEATAAENTLADLTGEKRARKDAGTFTTSGGVVLNFTTNTTTGAAGGASINQMEDHIIPDAHHAVEAETKRRQGIFATTIQSGFNKTVNFIQTAGLHSAAGANEAAHKIRMDAKLDSGEKH